MEKLKRYSKFEKQQLLADLIEALVFCGYDIKPYMGRTLASFDFEKVEEHLKEILIEKENQ